MDIITLNYWHWLLLGLIFIFVELATGTLFLLWLSSACLGVAAILWLWPQTPWLYQLAWYFAFVIISLVLWKLLRQLMPSQESLTPHKLNRRNEQYIGRTFDLSEAIVNGVGKIRVDDSTWRVSGEDCPLGTRVEVVAAEGMILKVRKLKIEN